MFQCLTVNASGCNVIEIKQQTGFTLLELIITMAISAILVTTAIPNFQRMIQDNRMSTNANALVSALNFARSEAVRRGSSVKVCQGTDRNACFNDATTTDWAAGWIVVVDADNDGAFDNSFDELLRVHEPLNSQLTLVKEGGGANLPISYNATGIANGNNTLLRLCDTSSDNEVERRIVISMTGRVSSAKRSSTEAGYQCPG